MSFLDEVFRRDASNLDHMLTLVERADYRGMLADAIRLGASTAEIDRDIARAKQVLKNKQDRMVWFLRWYRMALLRLVAGNSPEAQEAFERAKAEYRKRSGVEVTDADLAAAVAPDGRSPALDWLEHFLSLPAEPIQRQVFGYEPPHALRAKFQMAEKQWQEAQKDSFEPGATDKPILRFPNGFAWYHLPRAHCPVEGKAMGHCGNEPRSHTGDTILSLRQQFALAGKQRVKPYLTFILHSDGLLGEMKGRFNKSPRHAMEEGIAPSDFHAEIKALLMLPMITGIRGGGYKPEENFKLSDLPPDERESLLAAKPELGGVSGIYAAYGAGDKRTLAAIDRALSEHRIDLPSKRVGEDYVVAEWSDLLSFAKDISDGPLLKLLEWEAGDNEVYTDDLDEHQIHQILGLLPEASLRGLAREVDVRFVPQDAAGHGRMLRQMAGLIVNAPVYDDFLGAAQGATRLKPATKTALRARIDAYIETGYAFEVWHARLDVPRLAEGTPSPARQGDLFDADPGAPRYDLDAAIRLLVPAGELVEIAAAAEGSDETDGIDHEAEHQMHAVIESGWQAVDHGSLEDHRKEKGLLDRRGEDTLLQRIAEEVEFDPAAAARAITHGLVL